MGSRGYSTSGKVHDFDKEKYVYNKRRTITYELSEPTEKLKGDEFRGLRDNWTWKDDDVIIHTYPRSGTHLAWIMARYIVQESTEPFTDAMEDSHYYMFGLHDTQKTGRRVLSTHCHPADFPAEFWAKNGKRKHIAVMRNPKDTAVSQYHLCKNLVSMLRDPGDFEDYLKEYCYKYTPLGSWFLTVRSWEEFMDRHPELPIIIVYFEDMVADMASTVRRMAHFLGHPISEKLVQEIAKKCEFKEIKKQPLSQSLQDAFKDSVAATENLFYRKGKIGDWKNALTVAQSEMIDAAYNERMQGSRLRFRFC